MTKRVATINDLSGMGKCSLTVAIPVLSALGVQACPLPTAILSNQTGYPHFFIREFTDDMQSIADEWESLNFHFDGIYTGFLSDENQVDIIKNFVKKFKKEDTVFLVDPVMGDDGEVYPNFSSALIEKIRELAFLADIVTPNLTECCILTGNDYKKLIANNKSDNYLDIVSQTVKCLVKGNVKSAVITGIRYKGKDDVEEMFYNAVVCQGDVTFVKREIVGGSYSGTGDILASIICAMILRGKTLIEAVNFGVDFINLAVSDTYKSGTDRNHGVNFEKFMNVLTSLK